MLLTTVLFDPQNDYTLGVIINYRVLFNGNVLHVGACIAAVELNTLRPIVLYNVVGNQPAVRAPGREARPINAIVDRVVRVCHRNAIVVHIASGERVVATFLIQPRVIHTVPNFHVIERHELRIGGASTADANIYGRFGSVLAAFEDQSAGVGMTAIASRIGCPLERDI